MPFVLREERENFREKRKEISRRRYGPKPEIKKLTEIKFEYDIEPMTLYLHAKATINLPLYKFLAFYQAIEFYFPIYSNIEAKARIKRLLKDPSFDPEIEQNITKLLSIIRVNRGNEIGDEKSQLKPTISGCLVTDDLFEYFNQNENRKNFYEKNQGKCLSQNKISLSPQNSNIISDVAERIYDIRCRIVHKKADENNNSIILPFSPEVRLMKYDIELVDFIAQKLLIENSRSFR